jgi:hypothetical protein
MFSTFNGYAQQNKMKIEDVQEIWVYDYFDSYGYTRGSVYRKFQEFENNKTAKIQLNSAFVDSLKNMLIYFAEHKKLLPSKCGQNLIFAQFVLKDNRSRNIIIATNGVFDYRVGLMGYFFIDSSDKKNGTLWKNNYYSKILDTVNHSTEETEDSSLMNKTEGAYLNKIFETTRKDFDFTNKKVRFIMISGENSKTHYFDMHEKHSTKENYPCDNGTLYIFNSSQKAESGGYDAAIVYWSKFLLPIQGS